MQLMSQTPVWVTASDGTIKMTFGQLCNAVTGGLQLHSVVIVTSEEESVKFEKRRLAIEAMMAHMNQMTPEQATRALALVRSHEDLMDTSS